MLVNKSKVDSNQHLHCIEDDWYIGDNHTYSCVDLTAMRHYYLTEEQAVSFFGTVKTYSEIVKEA